MVPSSQKRPHPLVPTGNLKHEVRGKPPASGKREGCSRGGGGAMCQPSCLLLSTCSGRHPPRRGPPWLPSHDSISRTSATAKQLAVQQCIGAARPADRVAAAAAGAQPRPRRQVRPAARAYMAAAVQRTVHVGSSGPCQQLHCSEWESSGLVILVLQQRPGSRRLLISCTWTRLRCLPQCGGLLGVHPACGRCSCYRWQRCCAAGQEVGRAAAGRDGVGRRWQAVSTRAGA